jgi:hypothetical protein
MTAGDWGIAAAFIAGVSLILWLGNRFRRLVSGKITSNRRISERQFWRDPISTKEQAVQIIRRASRDLIGLCILQLIYRLLPLFSDIPLSITLRPIVALAVLIILAVLVGTASYVAALTMVVLTTLPAITLFVVAVYNVVQAGGLSSMLLVALPLCILLTTSWLSWRALAAIRKLRDKSERGRFPFEPSPTRSTKRGDLTRAFFERCLGKDILAANIRKGFSRLWLAVCIPWASYWGYICIDADIRMNNAEAFRQEISEEINKEYQTDPRLIGAPLGTTSPAVEYFKQAIDLSGQKWSHAYDRFERSKTLILLPPVGSLAGYLLIISVWRGFNPNSRFSASTRRPTDFP